MRAEYDSQVDALEIELVEAARWEGTEVIDDTHCTVAIAGGRPASIELLAPREHSDLLDRVAARYGLDADALRAAAQSALAAPDRAILLEVSASA